MEITVETKIIITPVITTDLKHLILTEAVEADIEVEEAEVVEEVVALTEVVEAVLAVRPNQKPSAEVTIKPKTSENGKTERSSKKCKKLQIKSFKTC